jgi:hypothetical protein
MAVELLISKLRESGKLRTLDERPAANSPNELQGRPHGTGHLFT